MSALAERNLVGHLFLNPDKIDEIAVKLRKGMFKVPIYADIFQTFVDGAENGIEVNAVVLQKILIETGYEEKLVNETLYSVADVDLGTSVKSCIESICNDYKIKIYEETIKGKPPKSTEVNGAIKQKILELESLLDESNDEIKSLAEIARESKDNYFKAGIEKKKCYFGLKEVDNLVGGIEGGDMAILAARPAVGKSAFSLQIIEFNEKKGKKIAYFNLEMREQQVYERFVARASGIEMARIRNATRFLNDEEQKFNAGNEKLEKMQNIYVWNGSASVRQIRNVVKKGKYDLVVIDYLQLVKPDKERGANRTAEVGDISRGIKAIAMDYDIPILALSQLNRASESRENAEPSMAELRESGAIEQDASVIILMWNSEKENSSKKKIKVDKARQGKVGTEELTFIGSTMSFVSANTKVEEEFVTISDDDNPFT